MKIGKLNLFSDFHFQIENEKWKSPSDFRFPFSIQKMKSELWNSTRTTKHNVVWVKPEQTRHVFKKHGCPQWQQSQDMAKISKS